MKRLLAVVLLLAPLVWPGLAARGATAADMDEQTQALLARLEQVAEATQTIQSDFVQTKHLSIFAEDVVSRGRFAYQRPDRLRWEYLEPVQTGFAITGSQGRRWNELAGSEEDFSTDNDPMMRMVLDNLLAWTRVDVPWLGRRYTITVLSEAPPELDLEPRDGPARAFIERFIVRFSDDASHVSDVVMREPGGDFTRIEFHDTEVNAPLPEGTF